MKVSNVDTSQEVLIIAEIGNNHEGKYALAEKMIYLAAESGVQAVKFQTFRTELYINPAQEARFKRLKGFELTFAEFEKLKTVADKAGVIFLSTPFDLESAKFLSTIVPAYKIGSGENTFYPLLEYVASTGLPLIMSTGLADINAIKHSTQFIKSAWREKGIQGELAVLHCVTSYPVKAEEANLSAISHLQKELGYTVGFSDHTLGIDAAVLSVALGARIIEKHFTFDKAYSDFRDHHISADPPELKLLVEKVKAASILLGKGQKIVQQSEAEVTDAVRRSIVAKGDLAPGHIITWSDLSWTRPAGGLLPGNEGMVIGKKVRNAIRAGEMITIEKIS